MKLSWISFSLLLVLLATTIAQAQTPAEKFKDEQLHFSIQFPGKPSVTNHSIPTEVGDIKLTAYSFETEDGLAYSVSVTEHPREFAQRKGARQLLLNVKHSAVQGLNIRQFKIDKEIELEGYQGLHLKGTSGFYYVIFKSYMVNDVLFQVGMLNTGSYPADEQVDQFFDSFELLPSHKLTTRNVDLLEPELFMSQDSSFRIAFPASPELESSTVQTDVGEVTIHNYKSNVGGAMYRVAYSDYPAALIELSEPAELLEEGKKSAIFSLGIDSVEHQENITMGEHPGLLFQGHNDEFYTVYKVYMVGNRLYQIAITQQGKYPLEGEKTRFLDSFELVH